MPWCDIHISEGVSQTGTDSTTGFSSPDPGRPQPSEGSKLSETVGVCRFRTQAQVTEDLRETKKKTRAPSSHRRQCIWGKESYCVACETDQLTFPGNEILQKERRRAVNIGILKWWLGKDSRTFCVPFAFSKNFWPMQWFPKVESRNYWSCLPKVCSGSLVFSSQDSFQLSGLRSQFSPKLVNKRLAYSKK